MKIQKVRPARLRRGVSKRVQGIGSDLDSLTLRGRRFSAEAAGAVLDAPLTRSTEGASTLELTLHDPEGELRGSKLLRSRFDVEVDDLHFRMVAAVRPDSDTLGLTFEAREVAKLRARKGRKKAFRDKVTRAEFVLMLCREVRPVIPLVIPELYVEQPIRNARDGRDAEAEAGRERAKGLDRGVTLTVKGKRANRSQIAIGERSLRVADSLGAPDLAQVALIAAAIQESVMENIAHGHDSSVGVLQLLDIHGSVALRMDVERVVGLFLTQGFTGRGGAIALAKQGLSAAEICARVQGNRNGASDYAPWIKEAEEWVAAYHGGAGSETTITGAKRYAFERKPNEDSWACIGRLAEEVRWRRFEAAGLVYFISDERLRRSKVRMRVREGEPGIEQITWDYDLGKPVQEVRVTGRAKAWAAPPGTACIVDGEGPADGRYLVAEIRSNLATGDGFEATLRRPMQALPEPAPETTTKTISAPGLGEGGGSKSALAEIDLGKGGYQGTEAVVRQLVDAIMADHQIRPGARKEPGHTAGGDHDPAVGDAFATDYPTTNGRAAALDVIRALGGQESVLGTYNAIYFKAGRQGVRMRAQVLWDVPGGGPGDSRHLRHVHVGVRRA